MAKRIVEWTKPNFHNVCGLFVLKPGVNEVEEDLIEKALESPIIRWYVDEGQIKISRGQAPEALARLKPPEAIALVKRTVDRDLLLRWAGAEKRKPVQEAIEAQFDAITPKKPPEPSSSCGPPNSRRCPKPRSRRRSPTRSCR
jgi:hypothetical protein